MARGYCQVVPDDLLAISGVAKLLGVSKQRADQLSRERGFPDPAADIDTGGRVFRAWSRDEVEAWALARGRA